MFPNLLRILPAFCLAVVFSMGLSSTHAALMFDAGDATFDNPGDFQVGPKLNVAAGQWHGGFFIRLGNDEGWNGDGVLTLEAGRDRARALTYHFLDNQESAGATLSFSYTSLDTSGTLSIRFFGYENDATAFSLNDGDGQVRNIDSKVDFNTGLVVETITSGAGTFNHTFDWSADGPNTYVGFEIWNNDLVGADVLTLDNFSVTAVPVPEPSSLLLFGVSSLAVAVWYRRRRQ